MTTGKQFWRSKTFWFAVIAILVGGAELLGYADFVPNEETQGVIVLAIGLVNLVLRFVTTERVRV